jgi:hypothetical protein
MIDELFTVFDISDTKPALLFIFYNVIKFILYKLPHLRAIYAIKQDDFKKYNDIIQHVLVNSGTWETNKDEILNAIEILTKKQYGRQKRINKSFIWQLYELNNENINLNNNENIKIDESAYQERKQLLLEKSIEIFENFCNRYKIKLQEEKKEDDSEEDKDKNKVYIIDQDSNNFIANDVPKIIQKIYKLCTSNEYKYDDIISINQALGKFYEIKQLVNVKGFIVKFFGVKYLENDLFLKKPYIMFFILLLCISLVCGGFILSKFKDFVKPIADNFVIQTILLIIFLIVFKNILIFILNLVQNIILLYRRIFYKKEDIETHDLFKYFYDDASNTDKFKYIYKINKKLQVKETTDNAILAIILFYVISYSFKIHLSENVDENIVVFYIKLFYIAFVNSLLYLSLLYIIKYTVEHFVHKNCRVGHWIYDLVNRNNINPKRSYLYNIFTNLAKNVLKPLVFIFLTVALTLFLFLLEKSNTFKKLDDNQKIQFKKRYIYLARNISFALIFLYLVYITFLKQ